MTMTTVYTAHHIAEALMSKVISCGLMKKGKTGKIL